MFDRIFLAPIQRHTWSSLRKSLVLSFLLTLLCCASQMARAQQYYFTIEVRQPAAVRLPMQQVQRVLLVNNSAQQRADFGHYNKRNDEAREGSTVDLSMAARQLLFGLYAGLQEQEVFAEVSMLAESQNAENNFYKRSYLTDQQVKNLCQTYGADAVLAMNQLVIYDLQESFLTDGNTYFAYLEAYCSTHWTLHCPGQKNVSFAASDTLIWEKEHRSEVTALQALPARQTALLDMAYYSGEQVSRRIFPQWVAQDRYVYQGKDIAFSQGLEAFSHQRWEKAAEIWERCYQEQKDKLMQAYAAADVALAYEMMEQFDRAIAWTDRAIAAIQQKRTAEAVQQYVNLNYYRSLIEKRKKEAR